VAEKLLRIGELSRRVGVSVELLRAWERRYGLLAPARTRGGFRLYGEEDVDRVLSMRAYLERGMAAAEAARLVVANGHDTGSDATLLGEALTTLGATLESFDETGAQVALDRLFAAFTVDVVLDEAVLPYLRELGERWERGEVSIAQEHFATNLVRARLVALARGWDRGGGPRALLACIEGELHDLPLLAFGLMLRSHGWRICYLGATTPLASIAETARAIEPAVIVVSGTVTGAFDEVPTRGLRDIGRLASLYVAGAAADETLARRTGAGYLDDDVVAAARDLRARLG
jgi:MerR family transcriptional regulator, light-induced transcriptional regulator